METGSPGSHLDEDDFDWEAAVREIDTACQATVPSTSYSGEITPIFTPIIFGGACPRPAVHPCRVRQSTLDRFVNDHAKQKTNNICRSEYGIHGSVEEDPWARSNASELGDGPLSVSIDLEAAKTWIYPVNVPFRDYQYTIAKNALFSNTLVALPTGLGKTLIAAVVMYNYFRWFPEGKIVFAAPSRPLVMQQIEACHNIVGIPQEWTIDMTGLMCPSKRLIHWKTKRVFFLTPQVFEKDIQSGICLVRQLVCLVFDEAHRAMGNYSYCVVVRELMAMPIHLRILALTATPGSKHQTIQNVIDNLYISTIEYRNECDRDVNMYMHSRELELIVVPMGMDAVKINSMLLEAIQPSIARLSGIGVLPHRAFSTLSPSELLNLRDNFRQAPPPSLPYSKHGEIESYFSILITFYHIRKLLSSHGIRPAYEMIQDKLNQGSFLKFVSKIEVFWKAKYLMQQSLSHGAPTPKMVKMMEVLVDHFKTKDPKNSRVIIFSNFRGSVRDIMSYLSSIGDMIKATEFIGQCSGKTKGQTQKVQQAVLEKFRSGGYNVIVATSIGEEGLDIMEVDLVICFDANVSPLRMIQRMGRTGRKNDGRVVVLACEGSEHKAYLKKQASSKAIRKHMHNGGIKSFNFHPSPRMVPHICKPQVQYLEMSIEQFVHRRKKVKNVTLNGSPFSSNLSNEEQTLIAKYFPQNKDATWTPSLIAFPSFQVFPSQVSRVRHSFKTTSMFIDAMQDLQGLSFSKVNDDDVIEVETPSQPHDKLSDSRDNIGLGSAFGFPTSDIGSASFEVLPRQPLEDKNGFGMHHHDFHKIKPHCFLFSKDSVTVSSLGSVLIAFVPVIQPRGSKNFPVISTINKSLFPEGLEPNDSRKVSGKPTMQVENSNIKAFTNLKQLGNGLPSSLIINEIQNEQENNKRAFQDPDCEPNHQDSENSAAKINCNMEDVLSASIVGRSTNPVTNIEMSPRLTRFIEEGVVPESPMLNINILPPSGENRLFSTFSWEEDKAEYKSYVHYSTPPNIIRTSDMPSKETISDEKKITAVNNTPIENTKEKNIIYAANEAVHTSANMNLSSSEEWKCNSGEASYSLFKAPKYKRLCKQGDVIRKLPAKILEKSFKLVEAASSSIISTNENKIKYKNGEKEKPIQHVDAFIEEEAEVSDDASVSEDEVVDEKHERYDDSFIDDRINSTEGSTEAENSGVDMTTFYRRSLLTQSPTILPGNYLATSGESLASGTTGSCSPEKQHNLIATPQHILQSADRLDFQNSVIGNAASATAASGEAAQPERCSDKLERRKRKLIFRPPEAIPEENSQLLPEIRQAQAESALDHRSKLTKSDTFDDDDDLFQGLDLDEFEAQATMLLRSRSELSSGKSQAAINDHTAAPIDQDMSTGNDFIGSLFDLGI